MINAGWANNCGVELFTIGWVQCPSEVIPTPTPPSDGGGRGSGPTSGIRREGYRHHREDAVAESRRKRILQEDDDIVALITSMLENRLM